MGVVYYVACRTCKSSRCVGKRLDWVTSYPKNRNESLKYSDNIEVEPFRVGLLLSFLIEHMNHTIDFGNDYDDDWMETIGEYKIEDDIFWMDNGAGE